MSLPSSPHLHRARFPIVALSGRPAQVCPMEDSASRNGGNRSPHLGYSRERRAMWRKLRRPLAAEPHCWSGNDGCGRVSIAGTHAWLDAPFCPQGPVSPRQACLPGGQLGVAVGQAATHSTRESRCERIDMRWMACGLFFSHGWRRSDADGWPRRGVAGVGGRVAVDGK